MTIAEPPVDTAALQNEQNDIMREQASGLWGRASDGNTDQERYEALSPENKAILAAKRPSLAELDDPLFRVPLDAQPWIAHERFVALRVKRGIAIAMELRRSNTGPARPGSKRAAAKKTVDLEAITQDILG